MMSELQSRHYPIQEDMKFQQRSWSVERVGWIALGLFLLVALAGYLGDGRTSARTVSNPPFTVEYDRFQRLTKEARYTVHIDGSAGERQLLISADFQRDYEIASVEPRPARSSAGPDGLDLRFAAQAGGLTVVIWAHPRRFGVADVTLRSGTGSVDLWSLVYP